MGKVVKTRLSFHNNFSKRQKISDDPKDMEQNAGSTENLVFTQSLSHEQLQNNREVLARRLQLRRPREELVNQGIMPAVSAAPIILQQKSRLERAQTSDLLQRKIRVRPDRSQLIQRHILEDSNADPSIQARQMCLKRQKLQDDLNERLLMRPGPLELVNKNILEPGSIVGHAIKEGAVEYSDTKNSTLIVNALSPPDSFQEDSPQPSPDNTSSIGSPSELSPAPMFPNASNKVLVTADSQFEAFQQAQKTNVAQPAPLKLKDTKTSRKKTSKAKFKKYKYHEYRPPHTETSAPKSDTSLPADSPYALLLQQQQLYLQLQVLCQNYPQTFLPLLPAVQKSSPADNAPAEKPMKLEEMRVIDLRNELKSRGLPVSGSKNNLMERLKLANATQGNTITSAVTPPVQSAPIPVAPRTPLSRSVSAPGGVTLMSSMIPAKILNEAEKILQTEQNISVEEIQQKIQQLQHLNVQLQLQQLDLKKSQQTKPLQPKPVESAQQMANILSNQQPLHHPNLQTASTQQPRQQHVQQPVQQQTMPAQQQIEQQLKQLQQQEQEQKQKQQQQLKQKQLQQQQLQQKKLQQQQLQQLQQQQQLKQPQQSKLYNQLSVSQASSTLQCNSESPNTTLVSLPPPQQCQVSISATPLLHCSALTCNKNCNHLQGTATSNSLANNVNSVQQHNVIHFKQPVKPVIILQPPKQQQRAELLFSPPGQQLDSDNEAFYQQLNKAKGLSSLEHDSNWQSMMDADSRSPTSSPTRSPPPYFEALAGKLSPRSASFSASSLNNTTGIARPLQRTNSCGSTSPLAHRRSLSVPSVNHSNVPAPQELQKGHKSGSMCLDFPEADEMSDLADNYHGITQELQKAMIIESQNSQDHRNAELLEILGDTLFPPSTATGSRSNSPNYYKHYNNSSPKAPISPSTSLPSYQEAIQNTLCVQSPPACSNFNTNELLNGFHDHNSPVNIQGGVQRKISCSTMEESLLSSPGSPMRVDNDDLDLRSVLDTNSYRRDSFPLGDFRTQDVRGNSLYHVNPSDVFGAPGAGDARFIKQEDTGLPYLDMDVTAAEFSEGMDFGMTGDSGISMSGITFSQ